MHWISHIRRNKTPLSWGKKRVCMLETKKSSNCNTDVIGFDTSDIFDANLIRIL